MSRSIVPEANRTPSIRHTDWSKKVASGVTVHSARNATEIDRANRREDGRGRTTGVLEANGAATRQGGAFATKQTIDGDEVSDRVAPQERTPAQDRALATRETAAPCTRMAPTRHAGLIPPAWAVPQLSWRPDPPHLAPSRFVPHGSSASRGCRLVLPHVARLRKPTPSSVPLRKE